MSIKITKNEKQKFYKKINFFIALVVTFVSIAIVFAIVDNARHTKVAVAYETITEKSEDEVCEPFIEAEIDCSVKREFSEIEKDGLVSQSILKDARVKKNTEKIELVYSLGPEMVAVPNLLKLPEEEALAIVKDSNLRVKNIEIVSDGKTEAGRVLGTLPEDEVVPVGSEITIKVSDGKIEVPNWKGKTKKFVESDAKQKGLNVKIKTKVSDKASGVVLSQSVKPGEKTNKEITVTISKAKKIKEIKVPNVVGLTPDEAMSFLAAEGFHDIAMVKVVKKDVNESTVSAILPKVGDTAKETDQIKLVVLIPKD